MKNLLKKTGRKITSLFSLIERHSTFVLVVITAYYSIETMQMRKTANLNYQLLTTPFIGTSFPKPISINGVPNGTVSKVENRLEYYASIENLGSIPLRYYCIWSCSKSSNPRTQTIVLPPGKSRDSYGRFKTTLPIDNSMIRDMIITLEIKYWTNDSISGMNTYKTVFFYDPARQMFEFIEDDYL